MTLEPCCHHGNTPPCTDAIIENKLRHVYIGSNDPNPKVAEKSQKILEAAGIGQTRGILKEECDALNTKFFHYISTGLPYVTLKYAMTADGKIASHTGKSQWITGPAARQHVHRMRHEYAGIMAGIGTVLADDPMLNCRLEDAGPQGASDPVRIIMDTNLRIPMDSQIVKTAKDIRTIIVTSTDASEATSADASEATTAETAKANSADPGAKEADLIAAGCEILRVDAKDTEVTNSNNESINLASVDAAQAIRKLGEMKISSILVEGGGELNFSILESGLACRVAAFIAPKMLGGAGAKTPISGIGFDDPNTCPAMKIADTRILGEDLLVEYDII